MLLLVTFRTDELHPGHPVHRLAATLARERLAERVELEPLSRDGDASMLAAALAHAIGLVLAARGRAGEAVARLDEAQRRWTELALPYEAARAGRDSAELRLQTDPADEEGIVQAREAAAAFAELGAALELERARRLLLRVGVRIPAHDNGSAPPVPAPLDQLTQREREVLAELTGGGTNKEIARALAIKPKTVGNHVSSILAKLDCATRTEAAGIALALRFNGGRPGSAARRQSGKRPGTFLHRGRLKYHEPGVQIRGGDSDAPLPTDSAEPALERR